MILSFCLCIGAGGGGLGDTGGRVFIVLSLYFNYLGAQSQGESEPVSEELTWKAVASEEPGANRPLSSVADISSAFILVLLLQLSQKFLP